MLLTNANVPQLHIFRKTQYGNHEIRACLWQKTLLPETKNTDDEKSYFFFPQKSGLYEGYVILCPATGGNKNERNK